MHKLIVLLFALLFCLGCDRANGSGWFGGAEDDTFRQYPIRNVPFATALQLDTRDIRFGLQAGTDSVIFAEDDRIVRWRPDANESETLLTSYGFSAIGERHHNTVFLNCTSGCTASGSRSKSKGASMFVENGSTFLDIEFPRGVPSGEIKDMAAVNPGFLATDGESLWEFKSKRRFDGREDLRPPNAERVVQISRAGKYVVFGHLPGFKPSARKRMTSEPRPGFPDVDHDTAFLSVVERSSGRQIVQISGAPDCKFSHDQSRLVCLHLGAGANHTKVESYSLESPQMTSTKTGNFEQTKTWSISADDKAVVIAHRVGIEVLELETLETRYMTIGATTGQVAMMSATKLVILNGDVIEIRDLAQLTDADAVAVASRKNGEVETELTGHIPTVTKELLDDADHGLARKVSGNDADPSVRRIDARIRPDATLEEVERALDKADVVVVGGIARHGNLTLATDSWFADEDDRRDAVESLRASGAFAAVAVPMKLGISPIEGRVTF